MPAGLRERKKLKTRLAIQRAAMRLFERRGYAATTIEDIAAAAEISPSTFFNYFSSKEAVFLEDEFDPAIIAALKRQPAAVPPVNAIHAALREVFGTVEGEARETLRRRMRLIAREPALRSAMLDQFASQLDGIAELVAARAGRPATDFEVRNLAGAFLGVMFAATMQLVDDPDVDMLELVDRALTHLERGLPI